MRLIFKDAMGIKFGWKEPGTGFTDHEKTLIRQLNEGEATALLVVPADSNYLQLIERIMIGYMVAVESETIQHTNNHFVLYYVAKPPSEVDKDAFKKGFLWSFRNLKSKLN